MSKISTPELREKRKWRIERERGRNNFIHLSVSHWEETSHLPVPPLFISYPTSKKFCRLRCHVGQVGFGSHLVRSGSDDCSWLL